MKIYFSKKMYNVEGIDGNPVFDGDIHTVLIAGNHCEDSNFVPPQNVNGTEGVAIDINSTLYGIIGIGSINNEIVFCAY